MKLYRRYSSFGYDLHNKLVVCEKALDDRGIRELDIMQLRTVDKNRMLLCRTDKDYDSFVNDIVVDGTELRNHFSKPIRWDTLSWSSIRLPETRRNLKRLLNPLNWINRVPIDYIEAVEYKFRGPHVDDMASLVIYLKTLVNDHLEVYQEFQESISYVCAALHEINKNDYLIDIFPSKIEQAENLIKEYYKFAIAVRKKTDVEVKEMVKQSIANHDDVMSRLIDGMQKINSAPKLSIQDAKKLEFNPPENTIRDANIYFSENMKNINETNIKVTSKERSDSTLGEFADAVCRALE
ncbi:hypothetical protein [Bacillus subtilis]|uniref:hypothetical protein n=1 Tax=Bacillus subtilis TaxID=1423 RepID=UPI0025CAB3C2|nr:hypothetical protein [Bacillus subtilis]GLI90475.1 hypothetical protein ANABIO4_38270 [Bacillus subtilis]